ncbi:MAG: AAA family ATPase [Desulfovibrionaceae bacterium]|nr:AAA family ATPase [Desulfovibrionaceae bacterium]
MYYSTVGIDSFREIRINALSYVDKTKFIKLIVERGHPKVSLFTRPRRFGKTLILSMLAEFFDINKKSTELFADLEIAKDQEFCATWMNQYPIINISLKQMNMMDYDQCLYNFSSSISQVCFDNDYLLTSKKVKSIDQNKLQKLYEQTATFGDLGQALYILCRALNSHWGKQVILLLDEYDVPLNSAWQHDYYSKMLNFIRNVFGYAFKGNEYLKFAIIIGCLRISKESIFTGVNNFKCFPINQSQYADMFGFTDQEVDHLLELAHCMHKKQEFKAWYDGYRFGNTSDIYCPWDVVNYLYDLKDNKHCKPQNYWLNSSSNDVIKKIIKFCTFDVKNTLETLLNRGTILCKIVNTTTYENIYNSEINLLNLLYHTGYLTKAKETNCANERYLEVDTELLRIPNAEIADIFVDVVDEWFKYQLETKEHVDLLNSFWSADSQTFTQILSDLLMQTISYYDYHENYYHAFIVGLFSSLKYVVKSNIETGLGRSDIVIYDSQQHPKMGACIEVKRANAYTSLHNDAHKALIQINQNKYDEEFKNKNLQIIHWGISFYKKSCCAISKIIEVKL